MKVIDISSLHEEQSRLSLLRKEQENYFHEQLVILEQGANPIISFLFPKKIKENFTASEGITADKNSKENDWFHKSITYLIPVIVDRISLGTKGLLINRGIRVILQFLADQIHIDSIPNILLHLLSKRKKEDKI